MTRVWWDNHESDHFPLCRFEQYYKQEQFCISSVSYHCALSRTIMLMPIYPTIILRHFSSFLTKNSSKKRCQRAPIAPITSAYFWILSLGVRRMYNISGEIQNCVVPGLVIGFDRQSVSFLAHIQESFYDYKTDPEKKALV